LDELICSIKEADNKFLDAEELDEEELEGSREEWSIWPRRLRR
jgi:low affinity Fe/Cu permease